MRNLRNQSFYTSTSKWSVKNNQIQEQKEYCLLLRHPIYIFFCFSSSRLVDLIQNTCSESWFFETMRLSFSHTCILIKQRITFKNRLHSLFSTFPHHERNICMNHFLFLVGQAFVRVASQPVRTPTEQAAPLQEDLSRLRQHQSWYSRTTTHLPRIQSLSPNHRTSLNHS